MIRFFANNPSYSDKLSRFMRETFNYALLYTICDKSNVCDRKWLLHYLESMKINISDIKSESSGNNFPFGEIFKSYRYIFIPCTMAGKEISIKSDVIDCDISMLIGKNAMKKTVWLLI